MATETPSAAMTIETASTVVATMNASIVVITESIIEIKIRIKR
jgi:hypothetical protein